jgi:hypothetical protein
LDAGLIRIDAMGDGHRVLGCKKRFTTKAELHKCLLPIRRVEVEITVKPGAR